MLQSCVRVHIAAPYRCALVHAHCIRNPPEALTEILCATICVYVDGTAQPKPCTSPPGNYCPQGSSQPAGVICPAQNFCSGGVADKMPCTAAAGSFCPAGFCCVDLESSPPASFTLLILSFASACAGRPVNPSATACTKWRQERRHAAACVGTGEVYVLHRG